MSIRIEVRISGSNRAIHLGSQAVSTEFTMSDALLTVGQSRAEILEAATRELSLQVREQVLRVVNERRPVEPLSLNDIVIAQQMTAPTTITTVIRLRVPNHPSSAVQSVGWMPSRMYEGALYLQYVNTPTLCYVYSDIPRTTCIQLLEQPHPGRRIKEIKEAACVVKGITIEEARRTFMGYPDNQKRPGTSLQPRASLFGRM